MRLRQTHHVPLCVGLAMSSVANASPRGSRTRSRDAAGQETLHRPRGLQQLPNYDATDARAMSPKGMGMSGGGSATGTCTSAVAKDITSQIAEVVTLNPERCCSFNGPTAVYVTHAQYDPSTVTGLETFWNDMYLQIAETSAMEDTCFVLTGYNANLLKRTLTELLVEVNTLVASMPNVPAMMSTDPTEQLDLANLFRQIASTPDAPSIGVFNAGLPNLNTEAIISGQGRIPYVGYTDDALYGSEAAAITLRLLDGKNATPICFNARPDLLYIGRRCAAYYQEVTNDPPDRLFGVTCRADSSVDAILALLMQDAVNAVFSHVDCCAVVSEAVQLARNRTNTTIVLGCQDEDTGGRVVNFLTKQPVELQAYQTSSWSNLPVTESSAGQNGESPEYFPSLLSLLNTEIYSVVFF